MSKTNAERKIALVEQLVNDAWFRLAAALDVVLLSETRREEHFTDDEIEELRTLRLRLREMSDRMRSKNVLVTLDREETERQAAFMFVEPLWHLMVSPGHSSCGAYGPNERLTDNLTRVTCPNCRARAL